MPKGSEVRQIDDLAAPAARMVRVRKAGLAPPAIPTIAEVEREQQSSPCPVVIAAPSDDSRALEPSSRELDGFGITKRPTDNVPNVKAASSAVAVDPLPARDFIGFIDGPDAKWRIIGWAQPLPEGSPRLGVRLLENGTEITCGWAERYRGDLLAAGIGDGNYGFALPLPARLFDGRRHALMIYIDTVTGSRLLGKLDITLPSRPPAMLAPQEISSHSAVNRIKNTLKRQGIRQNHNIEEYASMLTDAMKDIVNSYDYSTALGLLYVHLLGRRIDEGGLHSRIQRLGVDPDQFSEIIYEVLSSEECQARHGGNLDFGYPNLAPLRAWTCHRLPG